jgi:hypothetical protein
MDRNGQATFGDRLTQPGIPARLALCLTGALVLAPAALAQAPPAGGGKEAAGAGAAGESLASKVVDPTAPLKTITLQNRYTDSFYGLDGNANELQVQVAFPFVGFGKPNIFRAIVPYVNKSPVASVGLSDVQLLDIVLFPKGTVTYAAGLVYNLGTDRGGTDTTAAGPSLLGVWKKGPLLYGILNQNLFGPDVSTSQFQPILAYTFSPQVSVALGDMQVTVDWKKSQLVKFPLSGQLNYIVFAGKQPIRLFVNPQYNVIDEKGQTKLQITAGVALIVP